VVVVGVGAAVVVLGAVLVLGLLGAEVLLVGDAVAVAVPGERAVGGDERGGDGGHQVPGGVRPGDEARRAEVGGEGERGAGVELQRDSRPVGAGDVVDHRPGLQQAAALLGHHGRRREEQAVGRLPGGGRHGVGEGEVAPARVAEGDLQLDLAASGAAPLGRLGQAHRDRGARAGAVHHGEGLDHVVELVRAEAQAQAVAGEVAAVHEGADAVAVQHHLVEAERPAGGAAGEQADGERGDDRSAHGASSRVRPVNPREGR